MNDTIPTSQRAPRSVAGKALPRAEAITFGAVGERRERLFGHYHAPAETNARATGVVLVSPLGFEDLCTYATYRELADRLARAGFPTLRFDHHGTGDSAGYDADPSRVRAWLDGIETAIGELQARSGAVDIALFGVRMGALLAAAAASERGGVSSLTAWAPLPAGRAYVREVRAYRMLNNKGATSESGDEESAGFLLSGATVEALSKLDFTKLSGKIADHALVLCRDENKSEERIAKHLEGRGVATEFAYVPGYTAMMIEPRQSVLPDDVLAKVVGFLDARHPARGKVLSPNVEGASLVAKSPDGGTEVREQAVHLGEGKRLFGILTQPASQAPSGSARAKTALLLLTMAWHHRTGANRMHVSIARDAAAQGFSAFRFDISGSGDSVPEPGVEPRKAPPRHFVPEVQSAMRHLRAEHGIERFILSGVCSGGSLGHMVAKLDPSVSGVIIINPQRFYTTTDEEFIPEAVVTFKATSSYRRALFQKETWMRAIRGDVHFKVVFDLMRERATNMARVRLDALRTRLRGEAPKAESRVDLERMVDRGVDTLFIFSNDDPGIEYLQLHAGDALEKLRHRQGFRIEMIDGADHTFTPLAAQKRLSEMMMSHLVKTFG